MLLADKGGRVSYSMHEAQAFSSNPPSLLERRTDAGNGDVDALKI
jgi:hypothetical protein